MLNSPALVLSLAADSRTTIPGSSQAPMSPPPVYQSPPAYPFYGSTDSLASGSNVTLDALDAATRTRVDRSDLPEYDATPTLEPWLSHLRKPHWESSDLALFLPTSDPDVCATPDHAESDAKIHPEEMDWAHLRIALTNALISHDLDADPCADVDSDHMFHTIPSDVHKWIREEVPAELQSTCRFPSRISLVTSLLTECSFFYRHGSHFCMRLSITRNLLPEPSLHW
jgi:hypothetical protein